MLEKRNVYRDKLPDDAVDEVWQRFRDALMPLHSAGKLGAVLFQFPQWFVIAKKNKAYIEECAARLPDYRVAVEFRHESWMNERNREEALSFLEERNLPFVCVDMPQGFVSSVPPVAATTADDLAMVRFHGRDPEAWSAKSESASVRFRYDYTRGGAGGVGPADQPARRGDARDPRADEQLLPRLRRAGTPASWAGCSGLDDLSWRSRRWFRTGGRR